jgi:hypothetical protein
MSLTTMTNRMLSNLNKLMLFIKWISKKWMGDCIGLIWLRIGGLL